MIGTVLICDTSEGGGDLYGSCPYHGKFLYHCPACHELWRQAYPLTSAAISRTISSRGDPRAVVSKARKADEANGAAAAYATLLAARGGTGVHTAATPPTTRG